jgi:hypothetical protein
VIGGKIVAKIGQKLTGRRLIGPKGTIQEKNMRKVEPPKAKESFAGANESGAIRRITSVRAQNLRRLTASRGARSDG